MTREKKIMLNLHMDSDNSEIEKVYHVTIFLISSTEISKLVISPKIAYGEVLSIFIPCIAEYKLKS